MPYMYPIHNHSTAAAASGHGPLEHQVLTAIKYASYAAAGLALLPFGANLVSDMGSTAAASFDWAVARCASYVPTGLVAEMAGFLSPIPLIGTTLAAGGFGAVAIAAAVGIGGTLLGRYLESKNVRIGDVNVGKVVRWAALGTTMLFAMPAILSGIAMGLHFLSSFANLEFGMTGVQSTLNSWANAIGSQGTASVTGAYGALGLAATHGIVCGLPALITGKLSHVETPKTNVATEGLELGRVHDFRNGMPAFRAA